MSVDLSKYVDKLYDAMGRTAFGAKTFPLHLVIGTDERVLVEKRTSREVPGQSRGYRYTYRNMGGDTSIFLWSAEIGYYVVKEVTWDNSRSRLKVVAERAPRASINEPPRPLFNNLIRPQTTNRY